MSQTVRGVISRRKAQPVELVEIVIPDPGPGEVVVEVDATQAVRDILSGDPLRMYPDIQDGRITVVLRPIKPKP